MPDTDEGVRIVVSLDDLASAGLIKVTGNVKKAATEAAAANKTVEQSVRSQSNWMQNLGRDIDKTQLRMASFGRSYREALDDRTTRRVDLVGAALIGVAGIAVWTAASFDKQMSRVQAATLATAQEQDALRLAAVKAGAATVFTAREAADAETELAKAGVGVKDILTGGLTGALNLAAAGELSMAEAAKIGAVTLNQFGLAGSDMAHVADVLAAGAGKSAAEVSSIGTALSYVGPVAHQMGVTLEQTTGVISMFAQAGLDADMAGTGLRGTLMSLTSPSKIASKTMEQYNLNLYDTNGHFIGLSGTAQQLQDHIGGLDDATKNYVLGLIFGNHQITSARILMAAGAKGVDEWTGKVNDAGYAQEQASIKLDNLAGDIEKFRGALETGLIKSGESGVGTLRSMVQEGTKAVQVFDQLPGPVASTAVAATALAGAALLVGPRLAAMKTAGIGIKQILGAGAIGAGATILGVAAIDAMALNSDLATTEATAQAVRDALTNPIVGETILSQMIRDLQTQTSDLDARKASIQSNSLSGWWDAATTGIGGLISHDWNVADIRNPWGAIKAGAGDDLTRMGKDTEQNKKQMAGYQALLGDLAFKTGMTTTKAAALTDEYVRQGGALNDLSGTAYHQGADAVMAWSNSMYSGEQATAALRREMDLATVSGQILADQLSRGFGALEHDQAVLAFKQSWQSADAARKQKGWKGGLDWDTNAGAANVGRLQGMAKNALGAWAEKDKDGNVQATSEKALEIAIRKIYREGLAAGGGKGKVSGLLEDWFGTEYTSAALRRVDGAPRIKSKGFANLNKRQPAPTPVPPILPTNPAGSGVPHGAASPRAQDINITVPIKVDAVGDLHASDISDFGPALQAHLRPFVEAFFREKKERG